MADPVHVLVIFGSSSELTEQLALASAVGAVQSRASIRIRQLSSPEDAVRLGNAELSRMQREYVPPTRDDAVWADAIIIAMHNKVAGLLTEREAAVNYGRRVVEEVRAFKQRG